MALTRLFIRSALQAGLELTLDSEQAHYLGRTLRLRAGESLAVFNAESGEFAATIESIGKSSATLVVGDHRETATESPLRVHLVQGVSRGERMDFVVQKATELGVKRITPVLTEYGVVKLSGSRAEKRRDHWQKVAQSACEQSGRTRPPLIEVPVPLKTWFGATTSEADVDLILKPGAGTPMASLTAPSKKVCLLIGPEGGFSDVEYDDAEVSGFVAVSLGPRVLRTETAALAAVTVAETLWGDLGLETA
jgi:16S rRNA (uracil1498-N3)-methyltransferase